MKELTAKKREKSRAEKEKTCAEPQDVEMKEDEQKTGKEQDQLTLEGLNIIRLISYHFVKLCVCVIDVK